MFCLAQKLFCPGQKIFCLGQKKLSGQKDGALVSSNTTQDKKSQTGTQVKQNTFFYTVINDSSFSQKVNKLMKM